MYSQHLSVKKLFTFKLVVVRVFLEIFLCKPRLWLVLGTSTNKFGADYSVMPYTVAYWETDDYEALGSNAGLQRTRYLAHGD